MAAFLFATRKLYVVISSVTSIYIDTHQHGRTRTEPKRREWNKSRAPTQRASPSTAATII